MQRVCDSNQMLCLSWYHCPENAIHCRYIYNIFVIYFMHTVTIENLLELSLNSLKNIWTCSVIHSMQMCDKRLVLISEPKNESIKVYLVGCSSSIAFIKMCNSHWLWICLKWISLGISVAIRKMNKIFVWTCLSSCKWASNITHVGFGLDTMPMYWKWNRTHLSESRAIW